MLYDFSLGISGACFGLGTRRGVWISRPQTQIGVLDASVLPSAL